MDYLGYVREFLSLLGFLWGAYTWAVNRNEKKASDDRAEYNKTFRLSTNMTEKEIRELKVKLEEQRKEFELLKLSVVEYKNKMQFFEASVEKSVERVERSIEKHEAKLDNFGKVILK